MLAVHTNPIVDAPDQALGRIEAAFDGAVCALAQRCSIFFP